MKISLTQGYEAIIDDEDFSHVNKWSWSICKRAGKFYAGATVNSKPAMLHRYILGEAPFKGAQVDHINGDGLDNRRVNLRWATMSQNQANSGKRKGNFSSKFRGVYWSKQRNKWQSEIKIDYKRKHLGFFTDELLAAHAYNEAAIKYFGEFAKLNPMEGVI